MTRILATDRRYRDLSFGDAGVRFVGHVVRRTGYWLSVSNVRTDESGSLVEDLSRASVIVHWGREPIAHMIVSDGKPEAPSISFTVGTHELGRGAAWIRRHFGVEAVRAASLSFIRTFDNIGWDRASVNRSELESLV